MRNLNQNAIKEIKQYIIDNLDDYEGTEAEELHNNLFNTDYYCIGYYQAEQKLIDWGGVFENIGLIQEYEQDNFGEVTTELDNAESVCNMAAYIYGEDVLNSLDVELSGELDAELIKKIENELK